MIVGLVRKLFDSEQKWNFLAYVSNNKITHCKNPRKLFILFSSLVVKLWKLTSVFTGATYFKLAVLFCDSLCEEGVLGFSVCTELIHNFSIDYVKITNTEKERRQEAVIFIKNYGFIWYFCVGLRANAYWDKIEKKKKK